MAPMELVDPRKPWNPRKILDLDPMAADFTCAGEAVSKGQRCRMPVSWTDRAAAKGILDDMSMEYMPEQHGGEKLHELASLLLCKRWHQYQAKDRVRVWSARIAEWADHVQESNHMEVEIETLQEDNVNLRENLQRLKETHSQKAARDAKKIRKLERLSASQATELSDLQNDYAALEIKFRSLQREHTESVSMQEESSEIETELREKLANVEQRANQQKTELNEKTLEIKKAEKKEIRLKEKLSIAEKVANEREVKLTETLDRVEEIEQREAELKEKLKETLDRVEEVEQREVELKEKLTETLDRVKEAEKREGKLKEKLSVTEEKAEQTKMELHRKLLNAQEETKKRGTELQQQRFKAEQESEKRETELRKQLFDAKEESRKRETELSEQRFKAERESEMKEELRETISNAEEAARETERKLKEKLRSTEQEAKQKETELREHRLKAGQEIQKNKELREKLAESEKASEETRSKKLRRILHIGSRHWADLLTRSGDSGPRQEKYQPQGIKQISAIGICPNQDLRIDALSLSPSSVVSGLFYAESLTYTQEAGDEPDLHTLLLWSVRLDIDDIYEYTYEQFQQHWVLEWFRCSGVISHSLTTYGVGSMEYVHVHLHVCMYVLSGHFMVPKQWSTLPLTTSIGRISTPTNAFFLSFLPIFLFSLLF